jgi:hypothetical protein
MIYEFTKNEFKFLIEKLKIIRGPILKMIVSCALLLASNFALAGGTPPCFINGQEITVKGIATQVPIPQRTADGNTGSVWVLNIDPPICVSEYFAGSTKMNSANIVQIQIIGSPPPPEQIVELTGKLSTENYSENFAIPDAIRVTTGKRLSTGKPTATSGGKPVTQALSAPIKQKIDTDAAFTSSDRAAPIEHDAVLFEKSESFFKDVDTMVLMIRQNNYVCDSVSSASPMLFSNGFNFSCDHFRHQYDIKDMGGHWVVTVDN